MTICVLFCWRRYYNLSTHSIAISSATWLGLLKVVVIFTGPNVLRQYRYIGSDLPQYIRMEDWNLTGFVLNLLLLGYSSESRLTLMIRHIVFAHIIHFNCQTVLSFYKEHGISWFNNWRIIYLYRDFGSIGRCVSDIKPVLHHFYKIQQVSCDDRRGSCRWKCYEPCIMCQKLYISWNVNQELCFVGS